MIFLQKKILCLSKLTIMRSYSLLVLCILIFPVLSKAQFGLGKVSDLEAVQSRKLLVIVEQPSAKVLKKLQKKNQQDKISQYNAFVDEYNADMKKITEKFWNFSKNGIEYKTFKEAEDLRKSGNKDYAVLYCISSEMKSFSSGFLEDDGLDWTWDMRDESKDRDYFDGFIVMKISTIEDFNRKPVYYNVLPDVYPTISSLVVGEFMLQQYMDIRLRKKRDNEDISSKEQLNEWVTKNNKNLKNKTLLIKQDYLSRNYDQSKIAQNYPYKFQIVSSETLDSAVYNRDPRYVYAIVLPGVNAGTYKNQVYYMQAVFDAETGELCAYSMPSMGGMMLGAEFGGKTVGHRDIDAKTLTDFVNPK